MNALSPAAVPSSSPLPLPAHGPPLPAAAALHDAALHTLLDESLQHPPEFGGGMSSHLPMALAALRALGADEPQMRRFAAAYLRRSGLAERRVAVPAPAPLPDWPALRGRFNAFHTLQAHFAAALQRDGADAVLREALPVLMPGLAGAAFHGLIRTAHATESGHAGELVAALAYWAARWWPLPPGREQARPSGGTAGWMAAIESSLERQGADAHLAGKPIAHSIVGRMADAIASPAYHALAAGPQRSEPLGDTLRALARAAAQRYQQTGNFTVLHMATAMRAALVLLPWCGAVSEQVVLDAVWPATLAARIAAAGPASGRAGGTADAKAGALRSWEQVGAAARESDNDHTIKLVHAMAWLSRHAHTPGETPDPVWLAAAGRAVGP